MGGINKGRVLAGGLLAGLVFNFGETILNAVILADQMAEMVQRHSMREPVAGDIGLFMLMGFLLGIVIVWFYAAVRPRLGAGPKTAALVGAAIWIPAYLIPMVGWVIFGFSSVGMAFLIVIWGLVEIVLAAVVGAWVYKEFVGDRATSAAAL